MKEYLRNSSKFLGAVLIFTLLLSINAFALDQIKVDDDNPNGIKVPDAEYMADTVWVLVAAFLVFFMQAGFAMVEAGFTRAKNAVNILMKNLLDFSMGSIAFWIIGFAIMFGNGNDFFGFSGWFVSAGEVPDDVGQALAANPYDALDWTTVPTYAAWLFQLVFAATAATIVSGAMAERTQFKSYLIYSFFITALIYPIVGHWTWGAGWLSGLGFTDFAGSTVVHSTGGWLALAGAIVLGARHGKYDGNGRPRPIPGHNLPLAALGVFILWLGWFGFNPGSEMGAHPVSIASIAVTTNIAAAAGAIAAMSTAWLMLGKPDAGMSLNGALAGLVAITAGCANVTPLSAAIIGLLGGIVVVFSVLLFERLKVDDPVGAISVHGVCGALGTILLGLFHSESGLFYAADKAAAFKFLGVQCVGVIAVFAWCIITGFILFGAIKAIVGLRVTQEEEMEGLDFGEHAASAYPDFTISSIH